MKRKQAETYSTNSRLLTKSSPPARSRDPAKGATDGPAQSATGLTHVDRQGRIRMVDVGDKPVTRREAIARAAIEMQAATLDAIIGGTLEKGEALAAARLAGIMAAKR